MLHFAMRMKMVFGAVFGKLVRDKIQYSRRLHEYMCKISCQSVPAFIWKSLARLTKRRETKQI